MNVESDGKIFTPDMVLGPERRGLHVTYTTDTRPTQSIVDNAKDADLFICEGMYGEKGMEDKAISHKHMTFQEAAELAAKAQVNEMWLTHYSPSLVRPEEFMSDVRKIFPNTMAGKDGKSRDLVFKD